MLEKKKLFCVLPFTSNKKEKKKKNKGFGKFLSNVKLYFSFQNDERNLVLVCLMVS